MARPASPGGRGGANGARCSGPGLISKRHLRQRWQCDQQRRLNADDAVHGDDGTGDVIEAAGRRYVVGEIETPRPDGAVAAVHTMELVAQCFMRR